MKKILFSILLALLCLGFGVKKANAYCWPDNCYACVDSPYNSNNNPTCDCKKFYLDYNCNVTSTTFTSYASDCYYNYQDWGLGGTGQKCDYYSATGGNSYGNSGTGGGGAGTGCMK